MQVRISEKLSIFIVQTMVHRSNLRYTYLYVTKGIVENYKITNIFEKRSKTLLLFLPMFLFFPYQFNNDNIWKMIWRTGSGVINWNDLKLFWRTLPRGVNLFEKNPSKCFFGVFFGCFGCFWVFWMFLSVFGCFF